MSSDSEVIDSDCESDGTPAKPTATKLNPNIEEITSANRQLKCMFCQKYDVNEVEWGTMYKLDDIVVHYFCMLFSSALKQNGKDEEGIWGFLPKDIHKELKRGEKLKCKFCKKNRATVGCNEKTCKMMFHFNCGLNYGTLNQFLGNFESYCAKHKPAVHIPIPEKEWECAICMQSITRDENPMWPPCCRKRVFHRLCMQNAAQASGMYHFKCPCCSDKKIFIKAMQSNGVYVPERDAAWELETGAYADQIGLYSHCDAEECACPQGRDYSCKDNARWKVIRCGCCGAQGIHMVCGQLGQQRWKCPGCLEVIRRGRKTIIRGDGKSIIGSDSEDDDDDDEEDEESGEDVPNTEEFSQVRYNIARKANLVGIERNIEDTPGPSHYLHSKTILTIGTKCELNPRYRRQYQIPNSYDLSDENDSSDSDCEVVVKQIPIDSPISQDDQSLESTNVSSTTTEKNKKFAHQADPTAFRRKLSDLKNSCKFQATKDSSSEDRESELSGYTATIAQLPCDKDRDLEASLKMSNLDISGHKARVSVAHVNGPNLLQDADIILISESSPGTDGEKKVKTTTKNSRFMERFKSIQDSMKKNELRNSHKPIGSQKAEAKRTGVEEESRKTSEIEVISEKKIHTLHDNKKSVVTFTEYDGSGIPKKSADVKLKRKTVIDVITLSDSDTDSGTSSGGNVIGNAGRDSIRAPAGVNSSSDDEVIILHKPQSKSFATDENNPRIDKRTDSVQRPKYRPGPLCSKRYSLHKRPQASPDNRNDCRKRPKR